MLMMNEKIAYDFLFFYLFFEKKKRKYDQKRQRWINEEPFVLQQRLTRKGSLMAPKSMRLRLYRHGILMATF